MTELKTLKDLRYDESGKGDFIVEHKNLRQEAIKWIKKMEEFNYIHPYPEFLEGFTDSGFDEYASTRFPSVINFIKHFFNITEEELK